MSRYLVQGFADVRAWIGRFCVDASGSTAIVLGLSVLPVCAGVGLAVDYSNAIRIQNVIQKSLDASILAGARVQSDGATAVDLVIKSFVAENLARKPGIPQPTVTSTLDQQTGKVTATGNVAAPTYFMKVFGWQSIPIVVKSEGAFGMGNVELALVLDTTGSMAGSKLDGLKAAAKGLLDTLYASPNSAQRVKVGIVPFAQYVNVGMSYRNAPFMDVPFDNSTTTYQCYDTYPNATSSNCTTVNSTCYNDGVPYSCSSQQCTWNYGAPVQVCGNYTATSTWYGCVGSRAYPLDVDASSDFSTKIPGIMNVSCQSPLTRLTNDKTALASQIDAMVANGETYISSGVIWGWRLLAPTAPFSDGAALNMPDHKKIMIIMTDGANTKSPDYPTHNGSDATLANNLTAETCAAIKQKGVTIFTVAFGVTDASANSLLSACSNGPPYSYSASTTSDLYVAFQTIGRSLTDVRLTR